jgi:hypothetical protein
MPVLAVQSIQPAERGVAVEVLTASLLSAAYDMQVRALLSSDSFPEDCKVERFRVGFDSGEVQFNVNIARMKRDVPGHFQRLHRMIENAPVPVVGMHILEPRAESTSQNWMLTLFSESRGVLNEIGSVRIWLNGILPLFPESRFKLQLPRSRVLRQQQIALQLYASLEVLEDRFRGSLQFKTPQLRLPLFNATSSFSLQAAAVKYMCSLSKEGGVIMIKLAAIEVEQSDEVNSVVPLEVRIGTLSIRAEEFCDLRPGTRIILGEKVPLRGYLLLDEHEPIAEVEVSLDDDIPAITIKNLLLDN